MPPLLAWIVLISTVAFPLHLAAQDPGSQASDRERLIADRFMTVLMRRPRPGTALDRVYGFHVQQGSLDELVRSLEVEADATDAGPKTMILGLIQLQRGKPALAVDALKLAEERMPDDAACSYYLGRALLAIGQTEQAAAAMERAIERGPARNEALPIFTELGRIYGRAGLREKALSVWTKLEKLFPGDARVGGQIAHTLAEEGSVEEALKRYEKLAQTARSQEDKIAFAVQVAEMRRRLGQNEEATKELETILARLRPGSWLYTDVRNRIEDGFLKSGDYDGLANYYQQRLKEDSDNLEMQIRLGRVLVTAGRLDESREVLERAAERAPDKPEIRLALIDVLLEKGDVASAANQFEALSKDDPENPDYLLRWGQILLEDTEVELAERRKNAAKIWNRLADARQDDAVTLSQIADKMRSVDQKESAIELYRKAIDVDPTSPQYREYLGEFLYSLDRKDEAVEVWESIAADDRRNRDSLVRLAEVFATFGLDDRALESWSEAAELDLTFAQELRYATKLREAKQYDAALARLDVAESIAETPDEQEQLLKERITAYQQAGTLADQIAKLESAEPIPKNLRRLALMHQAAGQLTKAAEAIHQAIEAAPDEVDVLIVAADIAERQNRFGDAVEQFKNLSRIDTRFRTNYLQRIANLQMRLGQIDDAMETCEELIETNPASPDSYQFKARTAFRAGRDDEAITALRRAMTVAPRDNAPRLMLAGAYADRYRTDEAIELYWQALQNEAKADGRISLVSRIAPLYDRKGEIDTLIQRIEVMRKDDLDGRTGQLMIAAAHEAVQDFGAARQAIDRLLAEQPRDVQLLESMVRLCDAADEVVLAAEFQQRIVDLADTPENRFKLIQLKLDADLIDVTTALSERISLASDPQRLGGMIQSAAVRGDPKTAIAICREALRIDPSLWDVRLYLAQMLLHDYSEDREQNRKEAIEIARQIRELDFPLDASPPTSRPRKPPTNVTGLPPNYYSSPQRWSSSGYTLARNYSVGRYARSFSSSISTPLAEPSSFGHARVLAAALQMIGALQSAPAGDGDKAIREILEKELPLPPAEEIEDAAWIWERRALDSMTSYLSTNSTPSRQPPDPNDKKERDALTWRLAELDPDNGAGELLSLLMSRAQTLQQLESDRGNDQADSKTESANEEGKKEKPNLEPLSEDQLELIATLYEKAKANSQTGNRGSRDPLLVYPFVLQSEYRFAGDEDRASQYRIEPPSEEADVAELFAAIGFHLRFGQTKKAEALVGRLADAARKPKSGNAALYATSINGSAGSLSSGNEASREFIEKYRMELLDAFIAAALTQNAPTSRGSSSLSDGTARAYVQMPSGGYTSIQIKAPLSTNLLNQSVINELMGLLPKDPKQDSSRPTSISVPQEIINHLRSPLEDAPSYETKGRKVLAAFSHWWNGNPEFCYEMLIDLCEAYPDDVDLQIERARLASELGQPRVALETLDSFDPLDSQMLVRKEMAAMNLAAQLGDTDRARRSAERLFGMRMDVATQLALADQLQRLGLDAQAAAVRQRMRGGRSQSESVEIQIANSFLAGKDKEAAAEVAYNLLRKLNSGRSRSTSNVDYYRRQAVSILRSAGRLDKLIQQAERRVKSSPKSTRARIELAELYNAAGRGEDADKLWNQVADKKTNDPRQMMARAASLARNNKHREAALMYLDAFERQPQLFSNNYYEMTNEVRRAKIADEMYKRLTKMRPEVIPEYRIDELIRVDGSSSLSDAKREFIVHILKHPRIQSQLNSLVRYIPANELQKIPEYRESFVSAVCAEDAFIPQSVFWRVSSRSSGGTAIGPLEQVLEVLAINEDARKRFDEAATEAINEEQTRPTAEFLTALLATKDESTRSKAIEKIRDLVTPDGEDEDDPQEGVPGAALTHRISGGLLWQAGQVLEKLDGIEDKPLLLVAVYEASTEDPAVGRSDGDLRFSVVNRLIDAYASAGMTNKARRHLLDAYESTDHSEQNQYNPGYGDYQEISAYYSIGDKLSEIGCPIDALAIFHRAIAEPEKFERAKRWGGGQTITQFEKAAEKASQEVTAEVAALHLRRMAEDLEQQRRDGADVEIDLLDLPIELAASGDMMPGLMRALHHAKDSEEAAKSLDQLSATIAEICDDPGEHHWSLPATRLMIATLRAPDEIPDSPDENPDSLDRIAAQLMESLPSREEIAATTDTPASKKYASLLDLFATAQACMTSQHEDAKEIGEELCDYLQDVSRATAEPTAQLALASLTGSGTESLAAMLESIEDSRVEGQPLGSQMVESCMRIAKSAADRGLVEISSRALALALGQGPPLRQVGTVSDAFTIQSRNSSPDVRDDNGMGELIARACAIVDGYSEATGHRIGKRVPSADPEIDRVEDVDGALQLIADSLRTVVLPESRDGAVFPYQKDIVSTSSYDNFNSEVEIDPESLSISLGRAAKLAGRSEAIANVIRKRLADKSGDRQKLASVFVDIAYAAENEEMLAEAFDALFEAVEGELPDMDEEPPGPTQLRSISFQLQQESYAKSRLINVVLHAAWPIAFGEGFPPQEARGRARELLARVNVLIQSDPYTSQRHRMLQQRLRQEMLTIAAKTGDSENFDRLVASEMAALVQQYASYTGTTDYVSRTLEQLLLRLTNEGLVSKTPSLVRKLVLRSLDKRGDYQAPTLAMLCMEIRKLDLEDQFETLREIALGTDDDPSIAHWAGSVRYELPPEIARRQVPRADEVQALPTCTDEVPIADTILLLADVAAVLGKSESLARDFSERSTEPGDDADLASKLVLLAAAKSSAADANIQDVLRQVEEMLKPVAKRLSENKPTSNDRDLKFPMLEWFVVLRALDAGWPSQKAEPLMRDIKAYAVRGQYNILVSAVSRVIAINGIGRAAGATPKSPWKHFVPVPLPLRYQPDAGGLEPLFAMSEEDWFSGTGGYGLTQMMFRYPVTGSFTFSAEIKDGAWGEADVAYGGMHYQPAGYNKTARVTTLLGQAVEFPVPTIEHGKPNVEAIEVTPESTVAMCNGEPYVTDITDACYPWLAVTHHQYRTTQLRDVRIEGNPEIPREVNLITPTMRGWGNLVVGRGAPDPLLPIGPKQDEDAIRAQRANHLESLEKDRPQAAWSVKDGVLVYRAAEDENTYDPDAQLQYLRPLFDGETLEMSVWWEEGTSEVHPTVGRTILMLTNEGVIANWLHLSTDVSTLGYLPIDDLDPPPSPLASENLPKDKDWNTITLSRESDIIHVTLNGGPLTDIPVTGQARPGIFRSRGFSAKIRSMKLTGDWPTEVPEDLLQRAQ